jgi:hypothetical protein
MIISNIHIIDNLRRKAFLALCSVLSSTSCGVGESSLDQGVIRQAVAGGQIDSEGKWLGVIYLRTKVGARTQLCSGTLIAPNLVVTAMHCVAPLDDGDFQCDYTGNVIQAHPGAGELGNPVAAEMIEVRVGLEAAVSETVARGKQLLTTNSPNICTNDLAFVVLDTDIDLPLMPLRLTQETTLGEALTVVGYGMTEVPRSDTTRRYREQVRVTDLGTDDASNPASAAPPRTLVVGPSACQGDSGGPALALNKSGFGDAGQHVLAGVNSIAVGTCGAKDARSVFTRLDPFKPLVEDAFEAAGHIVWEEGQTDAGQELPDPEPEPTTEPTTKPDTTDTAKPRRLTTGCVMHASSSELRPWWALTTLLGYVAWSRRRTRPISFR